MESWEQRTSKLKTSSSEKGDNVNKCIKALSKMTGMSFWPQLDFDPTLDKN